MGVGCPAGMTLSYETSGDLKRADFDLGSTGMTFSYEMGTVTFVPLCFV